MLEPKYLCECEEPWPFVYGKFDPPCYLCSKCGLNVTARVEKIGMPDSSKECRQLLEDFLDTLEQIQERVVDSEGYHYGCFPFQLTDNCMSIDSLVCKVCRRLRKCGVVVMWKGDTNVRDI